MINTLAALLAALTVGAIILMALETDPIQLSYESLMATYKTDPLLPLVRDTDEPLGSWKNIVVHSTGSEGQIAKRMCHFIIAPGGDGKALEITATALWRRQEYSMHILGPNSHISNTSISVCIDGDFTTRRPTDDEFGRLMVLVWSLQHYFKIEPGHVYLYRDLDASTFSPGRAFPDSTFTARLLRPES